MRPANLARRLARGAGSRVVPAADGTPVAVINLMGQLFIDAAAARSRSWTRSSSEARAQAQVIVVDFHAEATSEKIALARWLDGRVTAVIGTHTHVQTNDARVLPGGTAAITDAGMTGPHDSVIGVKAELAIRRMRTGMPVRFEPADGGVRIEGAARRVRRRRRARYACEAVRVPRLGHERAPRAARRRARSRASTSHDAKRLRSSQRRASQ